jgi:CHAD domain-containing protein
MSRPSKWFVVSKIEQPALSVARRCLRNRLRHVWRMLRAATFHDIDQLEAVHQLRVATRRASTALDLFEPIQELLPATIASEDRIWVAKQLKKLRRAAGEARDADVLRQYYERVPAKDQPSKKLRKLLEERSLTTRKPVRKLLEKLRHKNFPARVQALLREMQDGKQTQPTFHDFARATVCQLWEKYAAKAQADLQDIEKLHEFRIETKEFRYALELFVSALPKELSESFYPRVSELQEALGTINDHAVAIDYWSAHQESLAGKKTRTWLDRELPQRAAALQLAHEKFLASWPQQWALLVKEWESLKLQSTSLACAAEPAVSELVTEIAQPASQQVAEHRVVSPPLTTLSWPESATPLPWQTS